MNCKECLWFEHPNPSGYKRPNWCYLFGYDTKAESEACENWFSPTFTSERVKEMGQIDNVNEAAVEHFRDVLHRKVVDGFETANMISFKMGASWQKQRYMDVFKELIQLANHQDGCYALENIQMKLNELINEE